MIEKELKFALGRDAACSLKNNSKSFGGILMYRRTRECNTIYDDGAGSVQVQDARLCLQTGREYSISFERALSRRGVGQDLVLETKVGSLANMKKILRRIGFRPVSNYARYRTTWQVGGAKVSLCEFSFGTFLECNGEISQITKLAQKLGFALNEAVSASYEELHRRFSLAKLTSIIHD